MRHTRQVGPLIEVGDQTTVGAGYLDRWVLAGVDRSTASEPNRADEDAARSGCPWTFALIGHESGNEGNDVFVWRTEAGVLSGVGRELLGLNIGFNRTTAVRIPNDSWLVLNVTAGDPASSSVKLERALPVSTETGKEGDE